MRQEIVMNGLLRTLEKEYAVSGESKFKVELAGQSIDLLISEWFKDGGCFCIKMKAEDDRRNFQLNGILEVFKKQVETTYTQNDWLVKKHQDDPVYRLELGGELLLDRMGSCFTHPQKRTYYDQGWWLFELIKVW